MSGDIMTFPKTVEEFMEQYKITDMEHVYTNGADLVPIFRMKQWFEHIDAESVKHGRWIKNERYSDEIEGHTAYECSECGELYDWFDVPEHKYCRHCGAKMMDEVTE